jgi:glycosyltransferase involved in cell wall biosynthesis
MGVRLASVILPVYNQASHIHEVLESHALKLKQLQFECEILPVVNGPRHDRSLEVCKSLEASYPSIRTLVIDEVGWGRAVRHGLANARGDLLCFANSARTQTKELVLMLLYGSVLDDTVIIASRKIRASFMRRLGSLVYNLECRALFDLPYWDVNGTPKVFHRGMRRFLELSRDDDLIDLEFNAICRREEYPVIEVPIFSTSRHSGKSTTTLTSAWKLYAGAWKLRRSFGRR